MPVLRMETDTVRGVGNDLVRIGNNIRDTAQRLEASWHALRDQWLGPSRDQFNELLSPGLQEMYRLAETCVSLGNRLMREVDQWEQVDEKGSRGFTDLSRLSRYTSGDGWHLVNTSSFKADELLVQVGGSCTIYGIMNLLVEEGIDISQEEANRLLAEITRMYGRSEGFPLDAARYILNKYVGEDGYTVGVGQFRSNSHVDVRAAEQFLVQNLSQGNPVYVWTQVDDSFGLGAGGHAYTVVGVQTDDNGNLTNVLVSTNWPAPNNIKTISASRFMDDWVNYYDCLYVTIP